MRYSSREFLGLKVVRLFLFGMGLLSFRTLPASAQAVPADTYFEQARLAAFKQKNYSHAIRLCKQALQQSPDYLDIQLFLGRLYYWNHQSDSSLVLLRAAFRQKPDYEDAAQALADITYFEKDYAGSLAICGQGLRYHPGSRELALRKAKSLVALSRNPEALALADSLLQQDTRNEELRSLIGQLREYSFRNKVGIAYDYTYFDRQFADAWHLTHIDYSRQTKLGGFTGRVSYASRYATNGIQFEAEAYPRLSKTVYAYTSIGYSAAMPVFPKLRAGVSLYANLPHSWEIEGGFRYLSLNNATWIYTASAGKYYRHFWFNARTYVSPGSNVISQSYAFTTRYYVKGADDYFSLAVSRGISPDDRVQAIRLNSTYRLQTTRLTGGYRFALAKRHIISVSGSFENGEYLPEIKGNQLNLSAGYQLRF